MTEACVEGFISVDREAHEPTSIDVGGVDLITLLEAFDGKKVEVRICLK